MAKKEREGFYTQITMGFKDIIVSRIKGRTIRYFIEGFYYMSEYQFEKVLKVIDEAHKNKTEKVV